MRLRTKLKTALIVTAVGAFVLSFYGLLLAASVIDAHMPRFLRRD